MHNRMLQRGLLFFSALMAGCLLMIPAKPAETFAELQTAAQPGVQARRVSAVSYALPDGMAWESVIFTRARLLQGKLMLLDEHHALPQDALPPNTANIMTYGNGMVPVRSLGLKTGRQTIESLQELFSELRQRGVGGIYVCRGTMSASQQKQERIVLTRSLMAQYPPEKAVQMAVEMTDEPGTGELLQEYAVDVCVINPQTNQPEERALEETQQGQTLLQLAWRYGWIRSSRSHPYRFRYVGKAHATAMTYLDLELAEYLQLLHEKGMLLISAGGQPQYLILCRPMSTDRVAFDLPAGQPFEASLDNTGYAVVACSF